MLIDLINKNDYININIPLIRVIGLKAATYISVLLSLCEKAHRKGKLINGSFFKIDRTQVTKDTTIIKKEQVDIDKALEKMDIIKRDISDDDIVEINVEKLVAIMADVTESSLNELSSYINIATKEEAPKMSKKEVIISSLKKGISAKDPELRKALEAWIDSIYERPNGFLSKEAVRVFEETLSGYAKGNIEISIEIVNIAIASSYKDCSWAINSYERTKKIREQSSLPQRPIRVTEQRAATISTINRENIF